MKPPDPDRDLVLETQQSTPCGREDLFRELYERHKDRIYNVCYRITGNGADALDAAQATFCAAFRKVDDFRFGSPFSTWLHRIAINASLDIKRREGARLDFARSASSTGEERLDSFRDPDAESPLDPAERTELEEIVQRALSRISPRLRAIVALRYFQHLSYDEIAEATGISVGTVKSRLFRAHEALGRELGPYHDVGIRQ